MTRYIDADRLMNFIRDEAAERLGHFKPNDPELTVSEDTGFIEGLETVALYVERVSAPQPTFLDIERGAA